MTAPVHPFQPRFSPTWSNQTRTEVANALRELAARLGVAITVAGLIGSEDGGFTCYSLRLTRLAPDGTPDPEASENARMKDPYT